MINDIAFPKIKNPQKTVLHRWIAVTVFSMLLFIYGAFDFEISSADGMFIMVSLLLFFTSLFFIRITVKNVKKIDGALHKNSYLAYWTYSKEEWKEYLVFEKNYRQIKGKSVAIFLSIITALIFVPFILLIDEGQLFMFFVMLGLFALYFFMGFVAPLLAHALQKNRQGSVLLLERGLLLDSQFHTWDFPLSKFNSAELIKKPYRHLAITYDFYDRTGPRSYTVNVPIPKNFTGSLEDILSRFH